MSHDTDLPDSPEFFNNAIPAPEADVAATAAMPSACARELGDYAEGDYAVSVKTQEAPSMEESEFAELIQARSP